MFKEFCQRAFGSAKRFLRDQSGSIIIYTGAFMAIGVGGAALSIDIGRIVLLRTQMQNRVDAGALAGAAQLDAQPGALERAGYVVEDSMTAYTTSGANEAEIVIKEVNFFAAAEDKISRGAETTLDNEARFVEVIAERRVLSFFYAPAMNVLSGAAASSYTTLDSRAVAMSDPFICKMQPLMVCNPYDNGDGTVSGSLEANIGFGLRIKQSPSTGAWEPGNFGLLDLPEDAAYGGGGAVAIQAALEAEEPQGCYAASVLSTATGSPIMSVKNGLNTRFYGPNVAPHVLNYPDDTIVENDPNTDFGDGVWDLAGYWAQFHPGVPLPSPLTSATRYQMYLFEQGQGFWKKNKKTSPIASIDPPDANGGWTFVDPANYPSQAIIPTDATYPDDNDLDGEPPVPPETVSHLQHERRNITIAVADCLSQSFQGDDDIANNGVYVKLFLYREATEPGSEGAEIYGEVVSVVEARSSLEFHGNVRLVE